MLEFTCLPQYNTAMSANSSPTFTSEHITRAQLQIFEEINKTPFIDATEREGAPGPLLTYLQDTYTARSQTAEERAELSQMRRAARFIGVSNGEKANRDSQEFFCGELFAAEFISHLIGTRNGTGELAQKAMSGFFEIDQPGGEGSESRLALEERHLRLAYSLQEKLSGPNGLLPPDFEAVIDALVLEKEARTILNGQLSGRAFDDAYPKFFVMGFRMVVNEAISSGLLEYAYHVQTTQTYDPYRAATNKFYGMPDDETLFDGTPVPTDDALDNLLEHSFDSIDYFLISEDRLTLQEQSTFIMAQLRAKLPFGGYDEATLESLRGGASHLLTAFAHDKKILREGDLLSAQGNHFIALRHIDADQTDTDERNAAELSRRYINANQELRGEYVGMEVIGMPDAKMLKNMLRKNLDIDPNDEAHHSLFVPAIRLRDVSVTQQNDNGGYEGSAGLGEHVEVLVPLIYKDVFLAKFFSSLSDEQEQSS